MKGSTRSILQGQLSHVLIELRVAECNTHLFTSTLCANFKGAMFTVNSQSCPCYLVC